MKGITILYVTSDNITDHERKFDLRKRYESLRTIPGTRSYHSFIPDGANIILKRISSDTIHNIYKFKNSTLSLKSETIHQPGKYIACFYDRDWYIGLILECSFQDKDVKVKFMQRKELNLQWTNDIVLWVPFTKVICRISAPSAKGQSGREFMLDKTDYNRIMTHVNE